MITISFEDDQLHDLCVDLSHAEHALGTVSASALTNLISEAASFENAGELIDFLDGAIEISVEDSLFVAIGASYRATLVVAGKRFNRDSDGRVVWTSVTRLKLVEILKWP